MSKPTASSLLASTADLVSQHLEEIAIGRGTTTISASEFCELVGYRQSLRNIGDNVDATLPTPPAFLGA
ncbi:hypothetical protein [Paraburkholderia sediminicola]|uniref:hypothetical protein n=1 Tax=Paraburkholderia sediminicola TaxID=458836 RepID=UPI0038BC57ED